MPPSSLPTSAKKRKQRTDASDSIVAAIADLEAKLTAAVAANASLNALADLLDLTEGASEPTHLSKGIYALYRIFVLIITRGLLHTRDSADENARVVHSWLVDRLNAYVELLTGLLKDKEAPLRTSALQILFSLQKYLSSSLSSHPSASSPAQPQFHISHFRKIVNALLKCPLLHRIVSKTKKTRTATDPSGQLLESDVRDLFVKTWFDVHDDIRWFFLREAGNLLHNLPPAESAEVCTNLLSILEGLTTFPTEASELNAWWVEELSARPPKKNGAAQAEVADEEEEAPAAEVEDDWRAFFDQEPKASDTAKTKAPSARIHTLTIHESLYSLASHRAVFTRTWLSLLRHLSFRSADSTSLSLRILNILHRGVIPHLTRPILIMDWVGSCVDYGGTVGLLALNALFTLMKEYNLDYPSFYTRLYVFLDRDVLHLKHRARFFRLTELFLSSTHLPAALVASFVKRLSRLSLNAPPAAIVMIIPFTYNLLKRHPALMPMIHRPDGEGSDPFKEDEPNPTLTDALDSTLWELFSHKNHYHSVVATLASIFEEAFTRPSYALEDFLDHTYGTMYDTEANRRIREEPAVISDVLMSGQSDVVEELWAFA